MEIIKCKFILIPKPTKKHLFFLMFILGILFRALVPDLLLFFKHKVKKEIDSLNYLLTQKHLEIARNIGSSLIFGIPHFYFKIINREHKVKQPKNNNYQRITYIYNAEKSKTPYMIKIILIISSVDIFCQLIISIKFIFEDKVLKKNILSLEQNHLYFLLFFDIFARYFFSRFILETYFYIHHKLSFLLNIIGLLPIAIVDIFVKCTLFDKDNKQYFDIIFIFVISLQLILYSFEDIMNKVAFRKLSILPCTLIFYNGLFQLCFFIIITIIFFKFDLFDTNINWLLELQYFICFAPFDMLRRLYLIKVIDIFSAQHMTLLKVSESIVIYIYVNIKERTFMVDDNNQLKPWHYIVQGIGFIFLFVSTLIHNELIIINHTKLKGKTEYYLGRDADKEQYSSYTNLYSDTFSESNSDSALFDDITGSDN